MAPFPLLAIAETADRVAAAQANVKPVRPWRLMRATTKAQWHLIRETLKGQERAVYFGVMAFWNRYQDWPTGMELLEFLLAAKRRNPRHPRWKCITDVNSVRPRLTGLNQKLPAALVVTGEVRLCRSDRAQAARAEGKRCPAVLTWRIPQLGEAPRTGRPPETRTVAA